MLDDIQRDLSIGSELMQDCLTMNKFGTNANSIKLVIKFITRKKPFFWANHWGAL